MDIIWLMPIHPLGEKARKGSLGSPYAIRDYRAVNPEYGTLEDFKRLVDEIHARGDALHHRRRVQPHLARLRPRL